MRFRILLLLAAISIVKNVNAQEIDQFRKKGFEAMQNGDYRIAIRNYLKIHQKQTDDYDARLALGRLYYQVNQCDSSLVFYKLIYANDTTDVEALNGFTQCFIRQNKLDTAIKYATKALKFLPNHVPQYLLLGKAYSFKGQIDKAIAVYRNANQIDSTWSEVWAELGKMYYWQSKPITARKHYEKAITLDSANIEIANAFQLVKKELKYRIDISEKYLQEKEETYEINAAIQRIDIQKRITDKLQLSAHALLDYSKRTFDDNSRDTTRWFNNSWVKATIITDKNVISIHLGGSNTDKKVIAYGVSWRYRNRMNNMKIENTINAGYDYFYYWNDVGRVSAENNLKLNYQALSAFFSISTGLIDAKPVQTLPSDNLTTKQNPYYAYAIQATYKLTTNPAVAIGMNHSFLNYKYLAPDYYTPKERFLTGPIATIYYEYKKFYLYGMYAYHIGTEKNYYLGRNNRKESENISVNNWTASADMGYHLKNSSISAGISRFHNPYYQNLLAFIKLTMIF